MAKIPRLGFPNKGINQMNFHLLLRKNRVVTPKFIWIVTPKIIVRVRVKDRKSYG